MSAVVWNMLGLAFRIAQSMAIDRDGELFRLKPFDTELRRRLWYQLLFLDLRAAEARGCLSTVLQYNTRPPTYINDSDIFPNMTEYPKPAKGLTEMTVPLIRYAAARLGRRLRPVAMLSVRLGYSVYVPRIDLRNTGHKAPIYRHIDPIPKVKVRITTA